MCHVRTPKQPYQTTELFFTTSIGIGLFIAASALVSRAVGAAERDKARRLSMNVLVFAGGWSLIVAVIILGVGLGVDGVALASVDARFAVLAVGLNGAVRVHQLLPKLRRNRFLEDVSATASLPHL